MADFNISQFTQKVQDFINENKIDKNGDKKINTANGELASLLSGMGAESAEELLMGDSVKFANAAPPQVPSGVNIDTNITIPDEMLEQLRNTIESYLGPTQDVRDILENILDAIKKYQTLGPDEQQTVRENTIKGLEEKWDTLYSEVALVNEIKPLAVPQQEDGANADAIKEQISRATANTASRVYSDISRYNKAFKEYDFMYSDQYLTSRDDLAVTPNGGSYSYSIADKVKDAGEKLMQQVDDMLADGSFTIDALEVALNEYQKTVDEANAEIKERTDKLIDKYQDEFNHDVDALENNTDGFPAIKGAATLKVFADAVNDFENSGVESPTAEQNTPAAKKYVENGRVVIERNGEKYDAGSGRRIE